jgi:hypothetical protein
MVAPVLMVLLALSALWAWSSWRARIRLLARLRAEWGHPRHRPREMDAVADFFHSHAITASLDDRTWNDLLLDEVFAHLDRTESCVGQQLLYHRLRSAPAPRSLDAFDALIARVAGDADRRERAQVALARLQDPSGYYVHQLARPDALDRRWWHAVFPVWSSAVVLTLSLAFIWPKLLIVVVCGFVVNFGTRIATGRRVGGEVAWFRQVGPLLAAARSLEALGTGDATAITGSLKGDLVALRRLGRIARWVSRDALTTGELIGALFEYLNVLLLMDASALYFAARELQSRAPALLRVIEAVGEIDAAIAVASLRAGAECWTRPRLVAADSPTALADLSHPLVDEAVPNSIALAPPHGVLVTGSNMSGKSTFLRTVGVNVVLAQTIHTCLARAYEAPVYQVRSCIGRSDDLLAGKSYYLMEVESVLALVRASEREEPHLFIFDELFSGTNAVERIAAAEAVLSELIAGGKPHVVLTATHDSELVELLRDSYAVCHFGDAVGPDGLVFDYHLTPGPATSRNAIALLELNGAPRSVVTRALARAAALDVQRQRAGATA